VFIEYKFIVIFVLLMLKNEEMKLIKLGSLVVVLMLASLNLSAQSKPVYKKSGHTITVFHYYENGAVKETGTYFKGVLHGTWMQYHPTGELKAKARYDYGDKEGKWFTWSPDGKELVEVEYEDNKPISVSKWKLEESNLFAER
jgi:antitoxin component YwqK of YwqJK toxin-antitoxin module